LDGWLGPTVEPTFNRPHQRCSWLDKKENATGVDLSSADLEEIRSILDKFPVVGDRYPPAAAKLTEY
jgi:hypothetical protein